MASENELIALRKCQRDDCQNEVPGGARRCQKVPEVPLGARGAGKNVVDKVEPVAPDISVASAGAAGPVNSGQQVQRKYSVNPERYSDAYTDSGSFWAVSLSEQRA